LQTALKKVSFCFHQLFPAQLCYPPLFSGEQRVEDAKMKDAEMEDMVQRVMQWAA